MSLFGFEGGAQGAPGHSMQKMPDEQAKLGVTPIETLSPEAARAQPTPADGAKAVMRERRLDPNDDLGVTTRDFIISRDYWLERAEYHLSLGEEAHDRRASWAHFQLAGRYLDRAYGDGGRQEDWESQPVSISILQ